MIGFILDGLVSEEMKSCKMSISIIFCVAVQGEDRSTFSIPHHSSECCFDLCNTLHRDERIYDSLLFLYPLSILQRFMFIKCVSHTQVRDD